MDIPDKTGPDLRQFQWKSFPTAADSRNQILGSALPHFRWEPNDCELANGELQFHGAIAMLIEAIREFNQAVPFVPYEIRTNGGKRLRVPHPDFVLVAPRGAWVIVADEKDHPHHISSILIEEVSPLRRRASGKRTKRPA